MENYTKYNSENMNYSEDIINNFNEIKSNYLDFSLNIIHLNIRSMRKNFLIFITNTAKILHKIHLIVLCETNITDEENSFLSH